MRQDVKRALELLPAAMRREIGTIGASVLDFFDCIEELRLRVGGRCLIIVGGAEYRLYSGIEQEEMDGIVRGLCHGALYAYRDCICRGFIPMEGGARVGIVGSAGYYEGQMVGVGRTSSLVFRIPGGRCDFAADLYKRWIDCGGGNMLILSPPGGGKTTALRSLASLIGRSPDGRRVLIVDERCEFSVEDYRDANVDVQRGYRRGQGIEIAVRSMSPEVIIVDEIANGEDAEAMEMARGAGVTVIASAHGRCLADIRGRRYLSHLLDGRMFSFVAVIQREGGEFSFYTEGVETEAQALCK